MAIECNKWNTYWKVRQYYELTISHKPMRLFKMLDATMRKAPCDYSKSSMRPLAVAIKNKQQDKLRKGKLNGKIERNVPQSQL